MVKCCIFFELHTEFLNTLYMGFSLKGLNNNIHESFHPLKHHIASAVIAIIKEPNNRAITIFRSRKGAYFLI